MRNEKDFYPTPEDVITQLLKVPRMWYDLAVSKILVDPFAGDGRILRIAKNAQGFRGDVVGVEIRDEQAPSGLSHGDSWWKQTDFMRSPLFWKNRESLIITNPPYSLGGATMKKCIEVADIVWGLLPLAWILPKRGREWMRESVPDLYPLRTRPSFTGTKTSPQDYAWFRWPGEGKIHLIL
jgi:hypothetical protein